MKEKLINFDWIVNNLIVHNLLINYLNLKKESIQKQLLTRFGILELRNLVTNPSYVKWRHTSSY